MAWIESHQSLGRHPKLVRLATKLRIHKAQAIGHLHYLWWWTLDFAPTGNLSAFTPAEISAGAEWPGEPGTFHKALRESGWMDDDGSIHDWFDYAGKLVAGREKDRERKRVQRMSSGCPPDVQRMSGVPNPTQPTVPDRPTGEASVVREVDPTKAQEAGDQADAEAQARCWISAEQPAFLKTSNVRDMATAIRVLGRDKAIAEIQAAISNRDVRLPFAWVAGKLEGAERDKAAAQPRPPPKARVAVREDR